MRSQPWQGALRAGFVGKCEHVYPWLHRAEPEVRGRRPGEEPGGRAGCRGGGRSGTGGRRDGVCVFCRDTEVQKNCYLITSSISRHLLARDHGISLNKMCLLPQRDFLPLPHKSLLWRAGVRRPWLMVVQGLHLARDLTGSI